MSTATQLVGAPVPSVSTVVVPVGTVFARGSAAVSPTSAAYAGSIALGNGVFSGSVTGLGLPFTPTKALLQIRRPASSLMIFACANDGTLTADGFDFELSGITDSTDYILDYLLVL